MTIGHRWRLTFVATATAGTLLAVVFFGVVAATWAEEAHVVDGVLRSTLRQATAEVQNSPASPDVSEVISSDPQLTLAIFRKNGSALAHAGRLSLLPTLSEGRQRLNGMEAVVATKSVGSFRLVVAYPWGDHRRAVQWLAVLLAVLWAPLTACAGLATWLASKATFSPLEDLARQAEAMTVGDLSGRLALSGNDEYGAFAARLNRFLSLIEESVLRQERFVADAAHELRTPLTVIRGRLETTLRRSRNEEEYRSAMQTALAEAERVSTLVEVLLKSAAPQVTDAERLDLESAAESAHARWVDRFSTKGIALDLEASPAAASILDTEMEVVLDNLLANALRVSAPGTHCRIEVHQPPGGTASVSVQDEGAGVPPEIAATIFERFTRGDEGRNRSDGGFGIGLAICRRLLGGRGATIRLEPSPKGARFTIEFGEQTEVSV